MFLTATPNASLDRILFIDRYESGKTMRTHKAVDAVGGKGFDVSVALRCLGQETLALGFKAGAIGEVLARLLHSYGIQTVLVPVEGETRIAHVVIEEALHTHSHIITQGYSVPPAEYAQLLNLLKTHLAQAAWFISSGSLPGGMPQDTFQTFARLAHEQRVPVLLDISGPPATLALSARPDILKMNQHEFHVTFGVEAASMEELAGKARRVAADHQLPALIITCGSAGILAITPQGTFLTRGPAQQEVNAAGAGDATSAATVWRLCLGEDWQTALRWAAAAGAATVLTDATAESDLKIVKELLPQVEQTCM